MSRGGYLNLESNGNFESSTGTLTVYVVAPFGEEFSSLCSDSDLASFRADGEADDDGER